MRFLHIIASAEASSNLARFDGVKYGYRTEKYEGLHNMYKKSRSEGFGPEVKRRIMLGSFVLSSGYYDAYYLKALRTKADYASPEAIAKDWEGAYQVSTTTSAYSTMVQAQDGKILFLYEEDAFRHPETEPDDYYNIVFKKLCVKKITAGKYQL